MCTMRSIIFIFSQLKEKNENPCWVQLLHKALRIKIIEQNFFFSLKDSKLGWAIVMYCMQTVQPIKTKT